MPGGSFPRAIALNRRPLPLSIFPIIAYPETRIFLLLPPNLAGGVTLTFITQLALRRSSVTLLVILLILGGGVYIYNQLERELFPDVEIPTIFITTAYPTADPETVMREVSEPIETAIAGVDGLEETRSTSQENLSTVQASFGYDQDMKEAERAIQSQVNGINFPDGVDNPWVTRINSNVFPIMQVSASGDRDIVSLQRILDDLVLPRFERVEGVNSVDVDGRVDEQVIVTVDTAKLEDLGLSLSQVADAITGNNISLPAGSITDNAITYPVRAAHELGSLGQIRGLTIGYERVTLPDDAAAPSADLRGQRPVLLSDVAEVELSTSAAGSISRTNGRPSLNIIIVKDPDANTVDVTRGVQAVIADALTGLPPDIQLLELTNDGPEVERMLGNLLRGGTLGFLFAITAVFVFLINLRPSILRGLSFTLRPTIIIGISIPLSVLSGILLMYAANMSLNFMSLSGLAIAVGRVVDDSIVVLENIYRHVQQGKERMDAAIVGTQEVGAAIIASTLTTVVVFIPLAFISGVVGEFFTPFALSVSFALLASTAVALTAVPVLCVILLRQGDLPSVGVDDTDVEREIWLQKLYSPILSWAITHKLPALLAAIVVTGASLALLTVIPITFFPAGTPTSLTITVELPPGSAISSNFVQVKGIEETLDGFREAGQLEMYQVTLNRAAASATFTVKVMDGAPRDIADLVRQQLPEPPEGVEYILTAQAAGPGGEDLEVTITGAKFSEIVAVARELEPQLAELDGVINLRSNISQARDEVTIRIDPQAAAQYGLSTAEVAQQLNRFILGQDVSDVDLEDITMDVVVRGRPEDADDINRLKNLNLQGPLGIVKLGSISQIAIEQGPVTVSRFDGNRSATITGTITAVNTQAVSNATQAIIDGLDLPPGVEIHTGGVFSQVSEGFQDIFTAMAIGIGLVYLVMVASLGSLRNPFIIVLSLPLAVAGALVALWITNRTLSMSALMGFLLLIGIVVTNAIVLITFVEQMRERGMSVHDALLRGGRVRIRPILMTAFTTTLALFPLALSTDEGGGIIGAELATVVIGGLISSTMLTLLAVPVIYTLMHWSIPNAPATLRALFRRRRRARA